MSLKTIKVNPIFLAGDNASFSAKNKTRKEKPAGISMSQSNNIKKKLIARIKNFQQNSQPKGAGTGSVGASTNANAVGNTTIDTDVFGDSVDFLNNLARDKEEKKREKKNTTLKKKQPPNPDAYMNIATELPPELNWNTILPSAPTVPATVPASAPTVPAAAAHAVPTPTVPVPATAAHALPTAHVPAAHAVQWQAAPQPSYSNLKSGGTRPTYRTWLRTTQKQKPVVKPTINILEDIGANTNEIGANDIVDAPIAEGPNAIAEGPNAIAEAQIGANAIAEVPIAMPIAEAPVYTPSLKPRRKRITRTLKYKLGKHANGKVSVLIKNSQTRRKVQTEQALLKQKSILDIKNHLRSNNLLKVGSNAPSDVLRHLYEQSILAGQIENKAKDTLIHNYFNEEKK